MLTNNWLKRCDKSIQELVRLEKKLLRCLNLECKPFSSSIVKTDLVKRTQKTESMHNGLVLIAISWEIFLSQMLSVLLQLYYSGSYFQKLKERRWPNSVKCLSKQTNRNSERGLSAGSTHTITKSLSSRVLPAWTNTSPHPPHIWSWYVPKYLPNISKVISKLSSRSPHGVSKYSARYPAPKLSLVSTPSCPQEIKLSMNCPDVVQSCPKCFLLVVTTWIEWVLLFLMQLHYLKLSSTKFF